MEFLDYLRLLNFWKEGGGKDEQSSCSAIMLAIVMILGGILLRLTPHIPNFAPISAVALFGGANLNKRFAILVPLLAVVISDYLLLYVSPFGNPIVDFSHLKPVTDMFHTTTLYVWGSFLISALLGIWLKNHRKPSNIIGATFLASVQFFLITNFGVWAGGMYNRDLDGLLESYLMGLPFFKWTLLGDLFYTGAFFGIYELAVGLARRLNLAANPI